MNQIKKYAPWALAAFIGLGIVSTISQLSEYQFETGIFRFVAVLSSGVSGFFWGWLFSPGGKSLRKILLILIAAHLSLALFQTNGWLASGMMVMLSVATFTWGLLYWLGAAARRFVKRPNTFGSAEWASLDYLREQRLTGDGGLFLGAFDSDRLRYDGDRHLLTIAPTRSGKGVTAIIPNLLTYPGSTLVIDPKGENAMITAAARRAMGHDVHVVDPWAVVADGSPSRFNPLDWLALGDTDITENAMLLADALVVPDATGDKFWTEEAKALLQGVILYVATDERERQHRHLGRVRDLLLLDGEDMPALFGRMMESVHHVVASTGARCLQKEEKLLANVVASAQAQTHFLDSPRMRESLSASDFKFEDLKTRAMTIYLVLPADRLNAFGRWLRLLIQQAITVNARNIEVKPPHAVLFILDEMPALGRLTMVEQAFGLMAGFGMQLWGIVQDAGQLKRIYGESWEGFVANSGAVQYFGSRDRMTAEYFSALCGVTTVWTFSSALSRSFGRNGSSSSNSDTTSTTSRKLAFPDELMRLHGSRQLVLIENHNPILARKVKWFEDDVMRSLGRDLRGTVTQ